jgi:hypothetical protein
MYAIEKNTAIYVKIGTLATNTLLYRILRHSAEPGDHCDKTYLLLLCHKLKSRKY